MGNDGQFLVNLIGGAEVPPYVETDEISMHHQIATLADRMDEDLDSRELSAEVRTGSSPGSYSGLEIGAAMNIVELLGQLLRRHPGSLEASVKEDLVAACVDLGLRTIGYILQELHKHHGEF